MFTFHSTAMYAAGCLAVFALAGPVAAQETRATLSGTITDSSGSIAPGAQLRLVNTQTQAALTAESNQLGQYRILL